MLRPNVLTGKLPTGSDVPCSLHECTKEELLAYFENAYDLDEWLFTSLKDEECFYKCPDRLRLPLVFYFCHTAVLYIHKLTMAGLIKDRVDENFEAMFETGVDEMSWDDTENYRMGGAYKWPPIEKITEYRKKVREIVRSVIQNLELTLPVTEDSPCWSVWLAIEHERIHLETSSVLIRQMPIDMVSRPVGWKYGPLAMDKPVLSNPMIIQKSRDIVLGKHGDCSVWGWDNEYGRLELSIPAFEASKYMITNREMLDFVQAAGYNTKKYWSEDGWKWRSYTQVKHPMFWVCNENCKSNCGSALKEYSHCNFGVSAATTNGDHHNNGAKYGLRLMFDVVALPADWPVEVNFHEAQAFCRWKGNGYRLITEAEQVIIRELEKFNDSDITLDPIYSKKSEKKYNFNMYYGSSTPVNMYPPTKSGFCDTLGNVWEWVEDHFNGFPGFTLNKYYHDYSAPGLDGSHGVIVGGSWISTGNEASRFSRFGFRRHFMQHAGFRVARTLDGKKTPVMVVKSPAIKTNPQEPDFSKSVSSCGVKLVKWDSSNIYYTEKDSTKVVEMAVENFCPMDKNFAQHSSFNEKICSTASKAAKGIPTSQVLLVGCAAGKLAFDLSAYFEKVVACDPSTCGIYIAQQLKENGKFTLDPDVFSSCESVKNSIETVLKVPENSIPEKVQFKQLSWLPYEFRGIDLIICTILDRDQKGEGWLLRIKDLLNGIEGGTAIIVSSWPALNMHADFNPFRLLSEEKFEFVRETQYITVWQAA
ncbi:uncharacterized protein LOC100176451 [Ciona intestinalis]